MVSHAYSVGCYYPLAYTGFLRPPRTNAALQFHASLLNKNGFWERKAWKRIMNKTKNFLLSILFIFSFNVYAGGNYTLNVGESMTLSFTPKTGILTNTIRWESNAGLYVEIESYIGCSATIKALKPISSTIIVQCSYEYVKYNGTFPYYITATEDFYININEVTPTHISIPNSISMTIGSSRIIKPTIYPSNATTSLTWKSNDHNIASISQDGLLFANSEGNTTISVSTNNGLTAYCNVLITKPTLSLSANLQSGLIEKGSILNLTASNSTAKIYYTLDGSIPNENCLLYTQPISINKDMSINAIAIKDGYYHSPIIQKTYRVSSLKIINSYPQEGECLNRPKLVPSIVFNSNIRKGELFDTIRLIDDQDSIVSGSILLHNNIISFIPKTDFLINRSYKLIIPQGSLTNYNNEVNFNTELNFSFKDITNYISISGGNMYSLGIKSDNTLWAWGYNRNGQLGNGKNEPITSEPIKIMDSVIFVSAGRGISPHSLAIKSDGTLWAWGYNQCGQLGDGTTIDRPSPIKIMDNVIYAVSGSWHSLAIKSDGTLWAWGANQHGQLGDGTTTDRPLPIKIMDNVIAASGRGEHSLAIKSDGTLWAWGYNQYGQLGDGTTIDRPSPIKLSGNIICASANYSNTFYIKTDGSLWESGVYNFDNQTIDFKYKTYRTSFIKKMDDSKYVDAAYIHVNVLKNDNSVWTWGNNNWQRLGLGDGSEISRDNPIKIITTNAMYITSGSMHSFCKKSDNTWWAWGSNDFECFGIGTTKDKNKPIKIIEPHEIVNTQSIELCDLTLAINDSAIIIPYNSMFNADYKSIEWKSNNDNIVSITKQGGIRGISNGKAIITTTITNYDNTTVTDSCVIVVSNIMATSISLSKNFVEAMPNDKIQLTATILPENTTNKEVEWYSSDETIAQVDDKGIVKIIQPGIATIEAQTTDGSNLSATCTISTLSSINNTILNNISVQVIDREIILNNLPLDENIYLYTLDGRIIVKNKAIASKYNICVNISGVYILKIGNYINKIIIK